MHEMSEDGAAQAQSQETNDIVAELLGSQQAGRAEADGAPREGVDPDEQGEPAGGGDSAEVGDEGSGDDAGAPDADVAESESGDTDGEENAEGVADDDGADDSHDDDSHADQDSVDKLSGRQLRQRVQALLKAGNVKGALKLATGLDPASFEINEAKYTAFRQHEARERAKTRTQAAKVAEDRQRFTAEVQRTVAQLQPYAKFAEAAQAYKQTGDTRHVRAIVEGLMGRPYNEAQKALLSDERRSPGEQAMAQQLEAVRRELEELKNGGTQKREQLTSEQVYQRDIEWLGGQVQQLGDPELAAIPKVTERIHRVLMASRDPQLGGKVSITFEEAAERVKNGERKRVEKSPYFRRRTVEAAKPKPAPATPLRRDSRQPAAPVGGENDMDIIRSLCAQHERGKAS